jgi:photosystem II stability/assembly factor-like uncharacterized protein
LRTAALLAFSTAAFASRWEIVYFHDQDKSSMSFTDIEFPSAARGVATGVLREGTKQKPIVLVTSDGGANWSVVETKEPGISLFFLTETDGWMVTPKGVWFTQEAGRSWTRILKRNGLARVYFLTRERGFAVGSRKTVIRTTDGGRSWKDVPEVKALSTNEDWTIFQAIDFANAQAGVIAGRSRSPRSQEDVPIWMDPQAKNRREWPSLSLMMRTNDGGETWQETKSSIFGRVSKLSLASDGRGLALIEFDNFFDYPSELYSMNLKNAKTDRCFRSQDFAVTDAHVLPGGPAFIAGFQPPGLLARTPVPGKVRIASAASDLLKWTEAEVDYRAAARRVALAVVDKDHAWAATDTGMILRLKP